MIEALLFASAKPMRLQEISECLPEGADGAGALEALRRRYQGRGVNLVRIGDAWAFRTAPDLGHLMHREAEETRRLSREIGRASCRERGRGAEGGVARDDV